MDGVPLDIQDILNQGYGRPLILQEAGKVGTVKPHWELSPQKRVLGCLEFDHLYQMGNVDDDCHGEAAHFSS